MSKADTETEGRERRPPPPTVSVRAARPDERRLIEGLAQFYIYDFSELAPPGSADFHFDAEGGFGPLPHMDDYWSGATGRHALLIEVNGAAAGFALINAYSHLSGGAVEHSMGEFFMARKYRRQGVASAAFHQVLVLHPGRWEVAVMARNRAAQAFWSRAIASAPGVREVMRHDASGPLWKGPIWSFHTG